MEWDGEADSGEVGNSNGGIYPFLDVPVLSFAFSLIPFRLFLLLFDLPFFHIYISRDVRAAGGEVHNLAGSPGGGDGIRLCHTPIRVHKV